MTFKFRSSQVIDRSRWVFGGHYYRQELGESCMLNEQGNMCCLGQICANMGALIEDLQLYGDPSDVVSHMETKEDFPLLTDLGDNTDLATQAMLINDDPGVNLEERERKLSDLFKYHGISLQFVGEYPERVQ